MTLTPKVREEIIKNNISKSQQAVKDAELLLNSNSFIGALNRIYYGIFYIISALAIKYGFSTSKHTQLIGWFNKYFVKPEKVDREIGKFIHLAFDRRMESDYDPLAEFSKEEVQQNLIYMKKVITKIEELINS